MLKLENDQLLVEVAAQGGELQKIYHKKRKI